MSPFVAEHHADGAQTRSKRNSLGTAIVTVQDMVDVIVVVVVVLLFLSRCVSSRVLIMVGCFLSGP